VDHRPAGRHPGVRRGSLRLGRTRRVVGIRRPGRRCGGASSAWAGGAVRHTDPAAKSPPRGSKPRRGQPYASSCHRGSGCGSNRCRRGLDGLGGLQGVGGRSRRSGRVRARRRPVRVGLRRPYRGCQGVRIVDVATERRAAQVQPKGPTTARSARVPPRTRRRPAGGVCRQQRRRWQPHHARRRCCRSTTTG
jgi:hypothetical protein